ncbi:MFS family permease [Brevundimonas vesicularis]|uniref:spinster family MFS transporter n=1 Tax=Brevundimonas vesicularis TaxID=41276 RepID=UPI00278A12D4|nr:MFS transporter [Brevundimonas vesicularis]MDQ1191596.1 MFS family permease [Brevundimonas vesicularis]
MTDQTSDATSLRTPEPAPRRSAYRYYVVVVLVLIYAVNFLDRQIMAILVTPIGEELNLSDTQLGMLSGVAFALFYATLGLPIARLADRHNRVKIIAVSCAIWSGFTVCCGLAGNFLQLAAARVGVGIGEAGGSPPSYSIIADYFPPQERGYAMSLYSLGIPLGITLGTAFGAVVADAYGWRAAFFAAGAPGLLLSFLLVTTVREPLRGGLDRARQAVTGGSLLRSLRTFFSDPVLRSTALSAGLSAFCGYGATAWAPAYLIRTMGMTLPEVALWYSVVNGIAMSCGIFLSGWVADRWARTNPGAYALMPALGLLFTMPIFAGFLLAPSWPLALALFFVPGMTFSMYLAPALSVVQNAVHPSERSTSGAILLLMINLIGLSGGPFLVGWVSDLLAPTHGAASLRYGLAALIPVVILAVLVLFRGAVLLRRRAAAQAV